MEARITKNVTRVVREKNYLRGVLKGKKKEKKKKNSIKTKSSRDIAL